MKSTLYVLATAALLILLATLYVRSQKGRFFWNRQEAGLLLLKGGYRSWKLVFCDGETIVDGKMKPVVISSNGAVRVGFFAFPKFSHSDIRKLNLNLGPREDVK